MSETRIYESETDDYVITELIRNITKRAILYMNSGYPVHLRGPAGVGKTSLAMHIAKKTGNPILLISGSEEINNENLIGGYFGVRKYFMEDNFITSVYKKEELMRKTWNDGRLLTACKEGFTVVYDEFTRTSAEVNNVFLSILEEKIVDIPYGNNNTYVKLHPNFKIIFTSNPEEYVGVHGSPNALTDRMITIDMLNMDEETEKSIIMARAAISSESSKKILELSRMIKNKFNETDYASIRGGIMLAKIVKTAKLVMKPDNLLFRQVCKEVFSSINSTLGLTYEKKINLDKIIDEAIDIVFQRMPEKGGLDEYK